MATALVVAFWVTTAIFLPALDQLGSGAAGNPASLPEQITTCGGDYRRADPPVARTYAEVLARDDAPPVVVSTSPFAACPSGACGATASDASCATVVYVQLGNDAYVEYSLAGGP